MFYIKEVEMNKQETQLRILALAIYELKGLLGNHLGSTTNEVTSEKISAHLAFSLHNEALAIIENKPEQFDIEALLSKITAIDRMFKTDFAKLFAKTINAKET
jgi:hypothetical protein